MFDFIPKRARVFLKLRTSLHYWKNSRSVFTLRHGRYVGVSKQKTTAMFVSRPNPPGIILYNYANAFFRLENYGCLSRECNFNDRHFFAPLGSLFTVHATITEVSSANDYVKADIKILTCFLCKTLVTFESPETIWKCI